MDKSKKTIEITFSWAIGIIVGAILTGAVGGAFGIGRVLNSDHFTLATTVDKVDVLEKDCVKQDVYKKEILFIGQGISELKESVKNLTMAVNGLYSIK